MPTPILSLHAITDELAALEAAIVEAGGEITDEVDEHYADLLQMHADKVGGYVAMIRRLESTSMAFKAESDRLATHARHADHAAKSLKERLLWAMIQRGEKEHATPLGKVSVRFASTRSVFIHDTDLSTLPDRFKVVSVVPDKRAIADALKAHDPEAEAVASFADPSAFLSIR